MKNMKTNLVCLMLATSMVGQVSFAGDSLAGGDSGFNCVPKQLPNTKNKPGTIFRVKTVSFGNKYFLAEKKFQREYITANGEPAPGYTNYSGMMSVADTTAGMAIELTVNEQKIGDVKAKASLKGKLSRTVHISQSVGDHFGVELSDGDLEDVYQWYRETKTDPNSSYFVVREVRFSNAISYSLDSNTAANLGIDASVTDVGSGNIGGDGTSKVGFSIPKLFPKPLVFCYKVERLKK